MQLVQYPKEDIVKEAVFALLHAISDSVVSFKVKKHGWARY